MVAVENATPGDTAVEMKEPTAKAVATKPPTEGDTSLESHPTALPICVVRDAKGALSFYESGLGATVKAEYPAPNGKVMHASLKVPLGRGFEFAVEDDGCIPDLVETANVEAAKEGATRGGGLYMYITVGKGEVDGAVEKMREAGAVVTMDCKDLSYGARVGKVLDPYGIAWSFASPLKTETPAAEGAKEAPAPAKESEAAKPAEEKKDEKPAITEEKKATETSAKVDAADEAGAAEKTEEKTDEAKTEGKPEEKAEEKPAADDNVAPMDQDKKEE